MAEASGNNFESHNHGGRNVNGQVRGGYVIQGDQHNHVHNAVNEQPGLLGDLMAPMASATHISNASDGPIWAKCDTDQAKLTSFSDDLEGRSLGDGAQAKMAAYGFCKVNRGDYLKFVPPAPFFDRFFRNTAVYISVFHADEN
uniref:Uncharacterized protein n=1 Tax=Plectus sambesii TaxID=2011161 RepID=A0A914WKN3_9BILA